MPTYAQTNQAQGGNAVIPTVPTSTPNPVTVNTPVPTASNPVATSTGVQQGPPKPMTSFSSDSANQKIADNNTTLANATANAPATQPDVQHLRELGGTWQSESGAQFYNYDSSPVNGQGSFIQGTTIRSTGDAAVDSILAQSFQNQQASDTTYSNILKNIQTQFEQAIDEQKDINMRGQASLDQSQIMSGSQRYAQTSSSNNMTALMSYGQKQIAGLIAKENDALLNAQAAQQAGKQKSLDTWLGVYEKVREEKAAAAQKLNDALVKANDELLDAKKAQDKDIAIGTLYTGGMTDPAKILEKLKEQGVTATEKEVSDYIDAYKKQSSLTTKTDQVGSDVYQYQVDANGKMVGTPQKIITGKVAAPAGTAAERSASAIASLQTHISSGQPLRDGTPVLDGNGFITPKAWKALIAEAPSEGLTRDSFIQSFGHLLYAPEGKIDPQYGLTPTEVKLITGALPE